MMPQVLDFARDVAEHLPVSGPVLEMGARPADEQSDLPLVRSLFPGVEYVGCDIQEGVNVDRVEDIHRLSFEDGSFGTVICLETLEHVADPIRAVGEMFRVLRPGGLLAISSVMFFPIHAHPWDYWRFTPEGFELLLERFETHLVVALGYSLMPEHVYGVGIKGPFDGLAMDRLPRTTWWVDRWGVGRPVDLGPMRFPTRMLLAMAARYGALAVRGRARHEYRRAISRLRR